MNSYPAAVARFRLVRRVLELSLAFMLGAAIMGCSDVITYSRESREKGMTYYNSGDYSDAAGAFKNAIRQNPADYQSHYYLGACYENGKAYNQAIQQYKTCLGVMDHSLEGRTDRPFRMMVLNSLAASVAKSEDRASEISVIAADPEADHKSEHFFVLAKVDRDMGDADEAIENYNKAALLDPNDFDIIKEYGLYLEQLGQTQAADPQLRRAYNLNSRDEQVNAALRRIGVVPGPGLKPENALARPVIPEGPIPNVDVTKLRLQNPFTSQPDPNAAPSAGSAQTPRD